MRPAQAPPIAPVGSTEAELVRRAGERDEAAIRSIMQSNNRRLYRLARGILRNDSEAEDVVQETYVRAFTHLQDFRGDSSLATWLGRIAINEALGRLRRQRANVEWTSLPPGTLEAQIIQFPLSAASEDPEKSMAQREIQHVVEHAIDDLPEAFRIVFITRVIEGMNVEETAEILGLKPETVKTRLHRARTMLRDNVEKKIGPVVMEAFPFAGKRCERLTEAVAALAGKRKRLHDHRADFLFDIVAQHGSGAVQSGFHGFRFQSENFRSLLDVHSLDHAGNEDDAKGFGEIVDGVLDDMLNFTLCHGFFRILGCGREGKLDNLRLERSRRQRGPFDVRALAAQPAQRLVDGDPSKPGCETGVAAEILKMGECPDIGFLHHVLGLAVVAQDSAGEPVKPAIVRLHDRADRRLIAVAGAPY